MIAARAPLRISLAGGGTDLPSYYATRGGFVIAAAIDKYVYVAVNRPPLETGFLLRYSQVEAVATAAEIRHPILREALAKTAPGIEIAVLADVPGGTGLGSSGAFTVALLQALKPKMSRRWCAEEAGEIEMIRLERPVGDQDNYTAAYGGVRCYSFLPSGRVNIDSIDVGPLAQRLHLFYLGARDGSGADDTLALQSQAHENLDATKALAGKALELLTEGRLDEYGALLGEHWRIKRDRAPGVTDARIDTYYEAGIEAGALGGKVCGAGGGGFLCFYTNHPARLRDAIDLPELEFGFDYGGVTCT